MESTGCAYNKVIRGWTVLLEKITRVKSIYSPKLNGLLYKQLNKDEVNAIDKLGMQQGRISALGSFSTRRNFPRGIIFSFVFWRPLSANWSLNKRKCHSAQKIPPSGKRPLREQSLKMLQTGVEEFKIFLWKISHPNIKFYFGFIPQQQNEKKVNTPTTKKKFNYRSLQQEKKWK